MSFKSFIFGTIIFGIITIICAIYSIRCLKKESSSKSGILSTIISACSLIVTLLASFQIKVPSPTIFPLDNEIQTYNNNTEIFIKSDEKGCTIYYTLDGSDPRYDGTKYNDVLSISDSTTVCARSKFWWFWSEIEKQSYEFDSEADKINNNIDVNGSHNFVNTGIIEGGVTIISDTKTSAIKKKGISFLADFDRVLQNIYSGNEDNNEQETNNNEEDTDLSEDKLFVKQNFNLIQQLKSKYSDEDICILHEDSMYLFFIETAGYVYDNLKETEICYKIHGGGIFPTKVIILDYYSDEIVYIFTPEQTDYIRYSPGDRGNFYCVILYDDNEIYVTCPFSVVGGGNNGATPIYLKKKDSEYSYLFQIRLYIRDSKLDNSYYIIPNNYIVQMCCSNIDSGNSGSLYTMKVSESGMLSIFESTYFSLNTDYEMNIFLYLDSNNGNKLVAQEVISNPVKNSNLIDIYLDLDNEILE